MPGKRTAIVVIHFLLTAGVLMACGTHPAPAHTPTPDVAGVTPILTPTAANTLEAHLDRLMRVSHPDFSGSILVAVPGEEVILLSYGLADRENHVANTPETRFAIGSLTKSFTAMAILILEERGSLSVKDSICAYIDPCPDAWEDVTIHHLLTHTSGIPSYTDLYAQGLIEGDPCQAYTTEEVIAFFRNRPLDFQPGSDWHYSNSGYFLLGVIIENLAGESYPDFVSENILLPLGMSETGYNDDRVLIEQRASGYILEDRQVINAPHWDVSTQFSAGGIYSTVGDLYLWDQALYANNLISAETLETVFSSAVATGDDDQEYGYGWFLSTLSGRRVVEHGGVVYGFSSQLTRYPDESVTIIILSNDEGTYTSLMSIVFAHVIFENH